MRFFYFIQKNYCIRLSSYCLCKLSAFFIAYIPWRRTYQPRHREFLHIFAHIYSDKGIIRIKQLTSHHFCKFGFSYPCASQENKCSYWFFRVFQTCSVSLDSTNNFFYGFFLPDNFSIEHIVHLCQFVQFVFAHFSHRNTTHHRNHLGYIFFCNDLFSLLDFVIPFLLCNIQLYHQALFLFFVFSCF